MKDHKFLQFVDVGPDQETVREIAVALMNQYFNANPTLGRKRWLKQPTTTVRHWSESKGVKTWYTSKPVDIKIITRNIGQSRSFDYKALELYDPHCQWLDSSVAMGIDFHATATDVTKDEALTFTVPTTLGTTFPLVPTLDREGQIYNSFQLLIQHRILSLRKSIVENQASFRGEQWFQDLRSFVTECVSLIDVTLHQIYFKAQYSPLAGWNFDPAALGPRHGRNIKDKLSWVFQITGKPLHARDELRAFFEIKDIRNHLQHFDPPCFCYTLEDVAAWINIVPPLARLCWKIRECVGSPLSVPLIEMLLVPTVRFVPEQGRRRVRQPATVGYNSTRWTEPPVKDEQAIRFDDDESERLDKLMGRLSVSTRRQVARAALRLGIEALEADSTLKPQRFT